MDIKIDVEKQPIINYLEKSMKCVEDKVNDIINEIIEEIYNNSPDSGKMPNMVPDGTATFELISIYYDENLNKTEELSRAIGVVTITKYYDKDGKELFK